MLSDSGPSWLDPLWIIDFGCAVILHGTIRYQKNQEMSRSKIDFQKKSWQPRGAPEWSKSLRKSLAGYYALCAFRNRAGIAAIP
jgi:hypothetical protein